MYNVIYYIDTQKTHRIDYDACNNLIENHKPSVEIMHVENNFDLPEKLYEFILYSAVLIKEKNIMLLNIDENAYCEILRRKRKTECFPFINRGKLWYDNLTKEQLEELNIWYDSWLNVTETLDEPEKPEWIK